MNDDKPAVIDSFEVILSKDTAYLVDKMTDDELRRLARIVNEGVRIYDDLCSEGADNPYMVVREVNNG